MKIVIIQPPLVQLNTPYPSGAYLSAFFRSGELSSDGRLLSKEAETSSAVEWVDMSILLFRRIFSRKGLETIFSLSEDAALKLAGKGDGAAFNLRRYLSCREAWIEWIDVIVEILCGGARELVHGFVLSPHAPRGARMENFLSSLETEPSVDDGRLLAAFAIEDLADYITAVFDPHFALVCYGESIPASTRSFAPLEHMLIEGSPVLDTFFRPLLDELFDRLEREAFSRYLFCLSAPFPGTVPAALYAGREITKRFGAAALRLIGGGYVNTELRNMTIPALFGYTDFLCYDRGYGALKALAECGFRPKGERLYGVRYLHDSQVVPPLEDDTEAWRRFAAFEDTVTRSIVPDYSGVDFSLYPCAADDANPMHRLWSDGRWLKAYLAHGCYWHNCAFCDVTLDYVKNYRMVAVGRLYDGLYKTAMEKNVRGIHFVDEAAPPAALRRFALLNLNSARNLGFAQNLGSQGGALSFWGNIRFERAFTRDLADFLCYAGLTGVSAGIEIATGNGLAAIGKGTDIQTVVSACAAFREAGVLVHGYMIYGYWEETPQELIDSAETLRQLFAAGLISSAFWHKFVLTRHSRVYSEWRQGLHPKLCPQEPESGDAVFADNDICFKGEERSSRYGVPLDNALAAWMAGEDLDLPVRSWFPFPMPSPSVPEDLAEQCIMAYERERDRAFKSEPRAGEQYIWIGGSPVVTGQGKSRLLSWMYMGEEFSVELAAKTSDSAARRLRELKAAAARGETCDGAELGLEGTLLAALRGRGLCKVGTGSK